MTTSTLEADRPISPIRRPRSRAAAFLYAIAAVPVLSALYEAVRAPRAHVLLDYWHVLAKVTDDDGSLLPQQLFTYHLDQPFVVPSLLFWADTAWFGGDNRVLTVLTVLLLTATVLLLHSMLPAAIAPPVKAALTAGFAWLLASPHLTELWAQGTNGISWVPAVFFCVLAIASAHRRRTALAVAAALAGCLSFGAALPIWFVLALVAWLRGEPRLKIAVPAATGVVLTALWFLTRPAGPQSLATPALDPDGRLSVFAAATGSLWSADVEALAIIAGGVTVGLLILCCLPLRTTPMDRPPAAGWAGLAAYALALAAMLALGRTTAEVPGGNVGLISRYALVGALATCALLVLIVLRRPGIPRPRLLTAILGIALVTHAIGAAKADRVRGSYAPLAVSAVALRVDAPAALAALHIQRAAIPAARALGGYPFNDHFTLGCGGPELGARIDLTAVTQLPASEGVVDTPLTGDAVLRGWAAPGTAKPGCVLVVDAAGVVVGGGVIGLAHPGAPGGSGWQAVAAPGVDRPSVLVLAGTRLYRPAPAGH